VTRFRLLIILTMRNPTLAGVLMASAMATYEVLSPTIERPTGKLAIVLGPLWDGLGQNGILLFWIIMALLALITEYLPTKNR
jgi:hypothetical protein